MDWLTALIGAAGVLFGLIVAGIIQLRNSATMAKKSDIDMLENSYKKLQVTYEAANTRLNNELEAERVARRADKQECQARIDGLQSQLTTMMTKLPEPGAVARVLIAGIDPVLPALPVKLTSVQDDVILSTEIKRPPLPWKMTIAEAEAAVAQSQETKE